MTAGAYDAELGRHNEVLRRSADVRLHDHVLDIGCGTGLTTRQAARAARLGGALGVDVSPAAIERGRELARAERIGNVAFEHADAQTHHFAPARFDLAISRFGTMFFADPVAAFANIRRALRPGGRLVMMVWQAGDRNEWDVVIRSAFGAVGAGRGPDPFSLADPGGVTKMLTTAGFAETAFEDVREPVYYGADVATAQAWVGGFTSTVAARERLEADAAARADDHLRAALTDHLRDDGVWFGSRAWIVTARSRPRVRQVS